jgi:pimeloyl-ACP methyl ester carboxylesterase
MTDALGYKKYSVFGTDWGCAVAYTMYSKYTTAVRAAAFDYIPFFPLSRDQLKTERINLDEFGKSGYDTYDKGIATGTGYFVEQSTEVCMCLTFVYWTLTQVPAQYNRPCLVR